MWRLDESVVSDFDSIVALHLRASLGAVGVRTSSALLAGDVRSRSIGDVARECIAQFRLRPPESSEVARVEADFAARLAEHFRVGADVREVPGATAALVALHEARIHVSLRSELPRGVVLAAVRRLRWEDLLGDVVAADGRPSVIAAHSEAGRMPARPGRIAVPI